MEMFKIVRTDKEFINVILSTSYATPLDQLDEIESILVQQGRKGKVLFDLLLCNGISDNRFLEMYFNGKFLVEDTVRVVNIVSEEIKSISVDYYRENPLWVEDSILPRAQRYLVKIGALI